MSLNGAKNNLKILTKITAVRPGGPRTSPPPPKYPTGPDRGLLPIFSVAGCRLSPLLVPLPPVDGPVGSRRIGIMNDSEWAML